MVTRMMLADEPSRSLLPGHILGSMMKTITLAAVSRANSFSPTAGQPRTLQSSLGTTTLTRLPSTWVLPIIIQLTPIMKAGLSSQMSESQPMACRHGRMAAQSPMLPPPSYTTMFSSRKTEPLMSVSSSGRFRLRRSSSRSVTSIATAMASYTAVHRTSMHWSPRARST